MLANQGVIKNCIIPLMVLILVFTVNAVDVGTPRPPNPDNFDPNYKESSVIPNNLQLFIGFDYETKELSIKADENSSIKNYTENCLNKKCYDKEVNFFVVDNFDNILKLKLIYIKSKNTNSIKVLSGDYNNITLKIPLNKFTINYQSNNINEKLKIDKINLDLSYQKKFDKTLIKTSNGKSQIKQYSEGLIFLRMVIINGNISYDLYKNDYTSLEIDCNWKPYKDVNGCYDIFGEKEVFKIINKTKSVSCRKGKQFLGYYFDGNSCSEIKDYSINGNLMLYQSYDECNKKCMPQPLKPIDCNWRPTQDISEETNPSVIPEHCIYFNGKKCLATVYCQFEGHYLFNDWSEC
ncbi:MAG: hypothetical protein Q8N99_05930 [Nanoarchaeota archaeon]|nr:hypothetical protein [Nanoarchaeota archaeon]